MLDIDKLENYFEPIIQANSNPFEIASRTIYKEDGVVKVSEKVELIKLEPIKTNIIDFIIKNSESHQIDFYPKNLFQRIFNKKRKLLLSNIIDKLSDDDFIIVNKKTSEKLKSYGVLINNQIEEGPDDTLIIGSRKRLIINNQKDDCQINYDKSTFVVININ